MVDDCSSVGRIYMNYNRNNQALISHIMLLNDLLDRNGNVDGVSMTQTDPRPSPRLGSGLERPVEMSSFSSPLSLVGSTGLDSLSLPLQDLIVCAQ